MGDITNYLLLDSSLLGKDANNLEPSTTSTASSSLFNFQSTSCVMSADSTLSQLMDVILSKITISTNDTTLLDQITVLDISYYPAKIITSTCRQFTQLTGPNSKTLQHLGWYPSGKLVVLPYPTIDSIDKIDAEEHLLKQFLEWQSKNVLKHEEFAYNNLNAANNMASIKSDSNNQTSAGNVQWTGVGAQQNNSTALKPSEIFNAVETRADAEIQLEQQQRQEAATSNKPKKKKKPTEKERAQRLDALLQSIDNKDSKKKRRRQLVPRYDKSYSNNDPRVIRS